MYGIKYLSMAGRIVLINSTLQIIHYYAMAAFDLPQGIKKEIQGKIKHYFWNNTRDSKHKAKANWSLISSPKISGGLRIKDIYIMNKAFQMKLTWKLLVENISLFSKVIKAKYYPNSSILTTKKKNYNSWAWKGICKYLGDFKKVLSWLIGKGKFSF